MAALVAVAAMPSVSAEPPRNVRGDYLNAQSMLASRWVSVELTPLLGGEPFPIFRGRDGRSFVAGETGRPYKIIVRNNSGLRLLVVPSVDGVNALTGQTASTGQSGYILSRSAD